jgi:lipopolysaccharide export system protein LptA
MMRFGIIPFVAVMFEFAIRASGQGAPDASAGPSGFDIRGIEAARAVAPAAPAEKPVKRPMGPTEITAREAAFDNSRYLATFAGEVFVRDPEFGLSCDRLTVNLKRPAPRASGNPDPKPKAPGEQGSGIDKAVAEGSVIITQDKADAGGKPQRYTGKGKRAVFDNATGTLTLYGWPEISESIAGNVSKRTVALEEGCVIILNRSGKMDIKGYHKSTIQDASELSQNPR